MSAKVLVRDERTGKYLSDDGAWVVEPAAAKVFENPQSAAKAAQPRQPSSVVLKYNNPPCELAINPVFCG